MLNHTMSIWIKDEYVEVVSSNVKSSGLLVNVICPEEGDLLGPYSAIEVYSLEQLNVNLFYSDDERAVVSDVRVDIRIGEEELIEIVGDVGRWVGWSD